MEEQRIIRFRILNQPVHSAQDVLLRGLAHRILLVIGQDDHILACIAKIAVEVGGHVFDVVDAASQLTLLTKVVDTDQECLASPCTIGILEAVALRGAGAKALHGLGRWRWSIVIALDVGIRIDGRETCGR